MSFEIIYDTNKKARASKVKADGDWAILSDVVWEGKRLRQVIIPSRRVVEIKSSDNENSNNINGGDRSENKNKRFI